MARNHGAMGVAPIDTIVTTVSPLRMPLLMMLSGLFLQRSLVKPSATYWRGKVRTLLWPYVVWALIMAPHAHFVYATDAALGPHELLLTFVGMKEHIWFIAYLFGYFAIAWCTRQTSPVAIAVVAYALAVLATAVEADDRVIRFPLMAVFFFLGGALARPPRESDALALPFWMALPTLLAVLGVLYLTNGDTPTIELAASVWNLPVVLAGIFSAAGVARRVAHARLLAPLRYVGQNSIVFYLVHLPAVIVAGQVFGHITDDSGVLYAVLTFTGLAAGVAFARAKGNSPWVGALFAMPQRRSGHSK